MVSSKCYEKDRLYLLLKDFCTVGYASLQSDKLFFSKGISNVSGVLQEELLVLQIAEILSFTVGISLVNVHVYFILLKL